MRCRHRSLTARQAKRLRRKFRGLEPDRSRGNPKLMPGQEVGRSGAPGVAVAAGPAAFVHESRENLPTSGGAAFDHHSPILTGHSEDFFVLAELLQVLE